MFVCANAGIIAMASVTQAQEIFRNNFIDNSFKEK